MNLLESYADKLIKRLNKRGYGAYLWHVSATNSIYIRFEDKEMCSIRIGDHNGRERYKYKFNIRTDIEVSYTQMDGRVLRHYYTVDDTKRLFKDVDARKKFIERKEHEHING